MQVRKDRDTSSHSVQKDYPNTLPQDNKWLLLAQCLSTLSRGSKFQAPSGGLQPSLTPDLTPFSGFCEHQACM